ncbi:hypothetical protein DC28_13055 [Spirochaeta lutea]|uniref:CAAX prenyl protease 2/Lysostaphin resistance protein A-like domain-containing protein n=1 Tax=Spirochaeta lutea TaxID=1480694 RepID=A0A098QU04_9SPIO|nr:hypothetical protein DC28_13055 [Spirochaeta lutea]
MILLYTLVRGDAKGSFRGVVRFGVPKRLRSPLGRISYHGFIYGIVPGILSGLLLLLWLGLAKTGLPTSWQGEQTSGIAGGFTRFPGFSQPLYVLVVALAALWEELFFRGYLFFRIFQGFHGQISGTPGSLQPAPPSRDGRDTEVLSTRSQVPRHGAARSRGRVRITAFHSMRSPGTPSSWGRVRITALSGLVTAGLFAVGHWYGGPAGLLFAFISGILLSLPVIMYGIPRGVVLSAAAHLVYNVTVLILAGN